MSVRNREIYFSPFFIGLKMKRNIKKSKKKKKHGIKRKLALRFFKGGLEEPITYSVEVLNGER